VLRHFIVSNTALTSLHLERRARGNRHVSNMWDPSLLQNAETYRNLEVEWCFCSEDRDTAVVVFRDLRMVQVAQPLNVLAHAAKVQHGS